MATAKDVKNVDDVKDTVIISKNKIKYINAKFVKVSAIMYDYKCDIKLKCGTSNHKAHRDVLSAASDYFSAMFSHNMKEKEQDVIELHGISPSGISVILDYFYHGFVTIEPSNIEDILEAARFFQVEWLVEVCCKFVVHHLSLDNYPEVITLSDKYFLGDLRGEIFRFLGNNLSELAKTPSFYEDLSLELLTGFLKADIFVDLTEDYLLYVARKWVRADPEKRKPYLLPLLRLIRFPLMDPEGIQKISEDVLQSPEIQNNVEEAKHYLNNTYSQCLHNEERFQARGSRLSITAMMFFGECNDIVHYDLSLKKLCYEQLGDVGLDIDFEYANTAQIGNYMFSAGGYGVDYCSTNRMFRLDPKTRAWTELAGMNDARTSGAMCSSETHLFICGGVNHQFEDGEEQEVILATTEMYDPSRNTWSYLPDLVNGSYSQAAAFHEDFIYITGGISVDPTDSVPNRSAYRLKIGEIGWEPIKGMLYPRQGHSMTTVGNKIFCIGGKAGGTGIVFTDCLQNEVYDTEFSQWTEIAATPANFGAISATSTLNNKVIYILGGNVVDTKLIVSLNSYDTETDQMETLQTLGGTYVKLGVFRVPFPLECLDD